MKDKLNICILINDFTVPLWVYRSIENLTSSNYANVTLIVSQEPKRSGMGGRRYRGGTFLLKTFEAIDGLLFQSKHNSHRRKNIISLGDKCKIYLLNSLTRVAPNIKNTENRAIADFNPDVLVLFGSHQIDKEILDLPRLGVWAFSIDNNKIPGVPIHGFQEVIKHHPLTELELEIVKDDRSQNEIIFSSRESTYQFSVTVNRNRVFWRATLVLPRIIEGLFLHGDSYLNQLKERYKSFNTVTDCAAYSGSFPTVIKDLIVHIALVLRLGFNKLIHTDAFSWQIHTHIAKDSSNSEYDFSVFQVIPPPRKIFWADPFVIAESQYYYVFVEEFIYSANKAHISLLQLDGEGTLIKSKRIIERPYHMSYPFVFKFDGIYYMIPETNQNKTIELYRSSNFPFEWTFERNLMQNISATDTTLFHYDDKWWMFTTIDQTGGISSCSTELFLFFADDPIRGEWKSHPFNPVISDESKARCAGKLFIDNGKIYRPSQDCSVRYGRGLNINQVTKLNDHEYNEVLINEIKPDWDPKLKGVHTINSDKDLTIIDTYKFHIRFSV
jgi:hypothetical protein